MNIKKIMILTCIAILLLAASVLLLTKEVFAISINFTDVKQDDWFYKNLQELTEKNIASGYPDGTFKPNNTLQFEEFIKMLIVAIEGQALKGEEGQEWHQPYVEKAEASKYITEDQKALIGQNISRGAMAEILYNALSVKENIKAFTDAELQYLSDRLTDVNKTDIKTLTINGIGVISGYPDGTFKPTNTLTRAEAVAVISRVINPALRNPVKIVARDKNGIINAEDLESIPVEKTNYQALKDYIQTYLRNEPAKNIKAGDIKYKVENVIKADASMFPIKYNNLVITGIELLPAKKAPYYGDNSITWAGSDSIDAIVIHAYPIKDNSTSDVVNAYWISGLNIAMTDKSGMTSISQTIPFSESELKASKKAKEMFSDLAFGFSPQVEVNHQFTTMALCKKGFSIKNIDKIILMDEWDSTWDVLEIDVEGINVIK